MTPSPQTGTVSVYCLGLSHFVPRYGNRDKDLTIGLSRFILKFFEVDKPRLDPDLCPGLRVPAGAEGAVMTTERAPVRKRDPDA
jgi:hypothetical protein